MHPTDHDPRRMLPAYNVLNESPGMQQDSTVTWEPVGHTATIKTWQIIVAVFLFACLIYGVVWWTRRRSENSPGSLGVREDHQNSSGRP